MLYRIRSDVAIVLCLMVLLTAGVGLLAWDLGLETAGIAGAMMVAFVAGVLLAS